MQYVLYNIHVILFCFCYWCVLIVSVHLDSYDAFTYIIQGWLPGVVAVSINLPLGDIGDSDCYTKSW